MKKVLVDEAAEYIRKLLPPREELLAKIEKEAEEKVVPIVEPEVARLLYWLALTRKAKNVLEVGTAIGYSTLWLAKAVLPGGGRITTLEINKPRYEAAKKNFQAAGIEEKINLVFGDARELIYQLKGPYDFIFLDAAKGKYVEFLEQCVSILSSGGLLVADDVFMNGMVISGEVDKRRNKTAVKRLRQYLQVVMNHPQLETVVIPIGDGIALSHKI
ncbi:MAG: O-methyltransferase [Desulfotomaculum sp.]|nr:O-methyltransferase [Desulfotomaculum sp.]